MFLRLITRRSGRNRIGNSIFVRAGGGANRVGVRPKGLVITSRNFLTRRPTSLNLSSPRGGSTPVSDVIQRRAPLILSGKNPRANNRALQRPASWRGNKSEENDNGGQNNSGFTHATRPDFYLRSKRAGAGEDRAGGDL